ncbi:MAG: hypothetical protein FWC96_09860 [Oscillospiraceae bacterium]|nr:hypothetical protein [Oscillospiraceae bacterium]
MHKEKSRSKKLISNLLQMVLFLVLAAVVVGGCYYLVWRSEVWYQGDDATITQTFNPNDFAETSDDFSYAWTLQVISVYFYVAVAAILGFGVYLIVKRWKKKRAEELLHQGAQHKPNG